MKMISRVIEDGVFEIYVEKMLFTPPKFPHEVAWLNSLNVHPELADSTNL